MRRFLRLQRALYPATALAIFLCALGTEIAHAQFARGRDTDPAVQKALTEHHGGAPEWRYRIYDLRTQVDNVDKQVRAKRDAFFNSIGPLKTLLDPDVQVAWTSDGDGVPCSLSHPVLAPPAADDIWVVATMDGVKAFFTPSHRSIYTELSFTPSRVLWGTKDIPDTGTAFQVGVDGGAIYRENGEVIVYNLASYAWHVLQNHKYLLKLKFWNDLQEYGIFDAYPIIDGVVSTSHQLCESSSSPLVGLTEDQAQRFLWARYAK